jgi:hypothetical protein
MVVLSLFEFKRVSFDPKWAKRPPNQGPTEGSHCQQKDGRGETGDQHGPHGASTLPIEPGLPEAAFQQYQHGQVEKERKEKGERVVEGFKT